MARCGRMTVAVGSWFGSANSTGGCNGSLTWEVVAMSVGRKQAPRPVRAEFWERVRSGSSPRDAGAAMGMRKGAGRWVALGGGVKSNGPGPVSGRYLSLADREEIMVGLARGESYRVIGARIGRPASTISREVRRNGPAKRYRALGAPALAEGRAGRAH